MRERLQARLGFFIYIFLLLVFDTNFSFMILNVFLAFAALELSFLLPLFQAKTKKEMPMSALFYALFIFMSPNVFYVVTDMIHFNLFPFQYMEGFVFWEWWNFFVLASGVFLSLYYYILMVDQLNRLLQPCKWKYVYIFIFMLLSSIGIFIGRFLRFHSIHAIMEPFSLLSRFIDSLTSSSIFFIIWVTLLQMIVYALFSRRNEGR